ncbi:hypothetical protein TSH100_01625 [Azospirillum sp. TSH100]|nr:hypothetical protein TSH100_01625 [Azospirillum sp. TSH100]
MAATPAPTPGVVTGAPPARADFPVLSRPAPPSAHAPEAAMLAVAAVGNRLVAAGERGIVLLSDDGGATWRQARVPVSVSLTALQFVNGRTGWAVGHLGVVLRTDDGGESWRLQLDGIGAAEKAAASPAGAAGAARSGQSLLKDGPDKPFLDLHFANDKDGMVVGAYGLAFRTEDGGASWTSVMDALPNPDGLHLYGLRAGKGAGADDLYIVGEQGLMLRSTDRGRSFAPLDSPYAGSWFGLTVFDDGSLLAYGLKGNAYRSSDRGDHWEKVEMPSETGISAIAHSSGRTLAVDQAGAVLESRDAGRRFALVQRTGLPLTGAAFAGSASDGSRAVLSSLRGMAPLAPAP